MKLIVGLGNPGAEYDGTRHNLGFAIIDEIAKTYGATWTDKPKFHAKIAETTAGGEKVFFAKPQTFYNLTGQSVRAIRDFYKLTNSDILVIHDEMDLPVGSLRTRIGGSDAGNNGIRSLNEHLDTDFARLRVGSGSEHAAKNRVGHVLSQPNSDEAKKLAELQPEITKIITNFIAGDFAITSVKIKNDQPVVE